MFETILTSGESLTFVNALICSGVSVGLGIVVALVYMAQGRSSKGFVVTLALLPLLVQAVIMMVNGNLGVGVAVLGAFSLVRFRSVPGSAREICCLFFAMAIGLATGMGFLAFAALITAIGGIFFIVLSKSKFGEKKRMEKKLKILVPEDVDYTLAFGDIFEKYLSSHSLEKSKTAKLGALYELVYAVVLKSAAQEKNFLDEIRSRNGNLTVCLSSEPVREEAL